MATTDSNAHSSSDGNNADIAATILELLQTRAQGTTICPSEVARAVQPDNWRPLMRAVRGVAAALAKEHRIDVRQRGRVIELSAHTRGPIRLSLHIARR